MLLRKRTKKYTGKQDATLCYIDSGNPHSREERDRAIILGAEEPFALLLKDSFIANTMATEQCIQTAFGGHSLPTAIKQSHPGITNLSNLVAMEIHIAHTVNVRNFGVVQLPINFAVDGLVHQSFNLAHGFE